MARRLTDKQKKKIYADYINNGNYRETARMNGVSHTKVKDIVIEFNKNESNLQKIAQKKEENTQSVIEYMQEQHQAKKRVLDKLLHSIELKAEDYENIDKMNIKDLATAYGIILDKELKVLELQRGTGNREDLMKVEELLAKLENEANK